MVHPLQHVDDYVTLTFKTVPFCCKNMLVVVVLVLSYFVFWCLLGVQVKGMGVSGGIVFFCSQFFLGGGAFRLLLVLFISVVALLLSFGCVFLDLGRLVLFPHCSSFC